MSPSPFACVEPCVLGFVSFSFAGDISVTFHNLIRQQVTGIIFMTIDLIMVLFMLAVFKASGGFWG